MFTGLVAGKGVVRALRDGRLEVETPLATELSPGDSIAVNGICLTAVEPNGGSFAADVMPETLRRTSLAPLGQGDEVNIELPLRAGDRLGGHFMQGHVDGTGTVESVREDGLSRVVRVSARRSCCATWSTRDRSPWTACPLPFRAWTTRVRGVADPGDARAHDARGGRAWPDGEPRGGRAGQIRGEAERT